MLRVIIAGLIGGALLFCGGAFSHMFLELEGRAFRPIKSEEAARTFVDENAAEPGIYGFPFMNPEFANMTPEEQTAEWNRVNERYKAGPAAYVIVAPRGEQMMSGVQLGGEFLFDVVAGLLAAIVASQLSSRCSFFTRWALMVVVGVVGWVSLSTSWALWYRFPWQFILDGLYVVLIEWAAAGLAIALIVRPRAATNGKV
jgi:hypothetical protein